MPTTEEAMLNALKQFYEAMNKWEVDVIALKKLVVESEISQEEFNQRFQQNLRNVMSVHCGKSAEMRGIRFSPFEPAYVPAELEPVRIAADGGRGEITTKGKLDRDIVFKMIFEDESWKVLKRHTIGYGGEILPETL